MIYVMLIMHAYAINIPLKVSMRTLTGGYMNRARVAFAAVATGAILSSLAMPATAASDKGDLSPQKSKSYVIKMTEHSEIRSVVKGQTAKTKSIGATHFFTPQNPDYRGNDRSGHFTGQVHYNSRRMYFAWGYKLHKQISAPATGPMHEKAFATKNGRKFGYSDSHPSVPASYTVHSSFKVSTGSYKLTIDENFPIPRGKRYVHTTFDFVVTLV
ncbi:hypothetical protein JQK87_03470 [Streptomyces sp. G44]|uniref:hypothetical protein n=1 Tax=Streptomyces sp. G44 TaxID=2807632 RepID=UPI00195F2515|nr:hypothetical protein [Streptomyces sp. G44]MBM7167488.1 hypothetical protein [Streptomyces sp. G44]